MLGHATPTPGPETPMDSEYNVEKFVLMIRMMRAFIIFSKMVQTICNTSENKLMLKILNGVEIFAYMGVILFEQFFVILHPPKEADSKFVYRAKYLMVIDVILFYALIMSTIIFLTFI